MLVVVAISTQLHWLRHTAPATVTIITCNKKIQCGFFRHLTVVLH